MQSPAEQPEIIRIQLHTLDASNNAGGQKSPQQDLLPVAVIYTGGTIGMVNSEQGLIPGGNMSQRLLKALLRLPSERFQALPNFDLITLPRLIDSSNATPHDWLQLNQLIHQYAAQYHAFIILHGTDTLAYTASALSFIAPSNKKILITGSQYPLEADNTDAINNIEGALLYTQLSSHQKSLKQNSPEKNSLEQQVSPPISNSTPSELGVSGVFGGKILQGNRMTKVSTYSPQGFDSPNTEPLRFYNHGKLQPNTQKAPSTETITTITKITPKPQLQVSDAQVVILKLWPGIQAHQVGSLLASPIKGVVLESYGSGNAPDLNQPLLAALKAATDQGIIIVNRSQCPQGSVSTNYAAGSALAKAGIISAFDMTCEAAFSKLSLLLMSGLSIEDVKIAFQRNLSGEFSV
ncbi:asparaginase [Oceanospirillum maris]|uniref:asparaginase n=1 Tax=Oceanospirillum maris TaxID=64977 RepID=UPI00041975CC|nr:asparaginase [Oceanospirillum maris]